MTPLPPTKLGRYEVIDEIGKGAMGIVYLARDPLIGRLVALKTFRIAYSVRELEMEQFRARFLREAQSAGILSHPNIVTIHDVVEESEDGLAFIAMEYVQGTNLKMLMQRDSSLDPGFVASVVEQVAAALDYAHSRKVVHRDIKPANIIITADNKVKITDFGIARLDTSNLTQEGQLLGTPNYMAPEQILGHDLDHRADLFSLGVVLYEMLTRHKPFQGENLTVVSHRIVYDQFTAPRQYAQSLPAGTEAILQRALEKDPARRFQRARDLAEEVRRVIAPPISIAEGLNDTQSLSATAMVLPAPPPARDGTGTGTGTGSRPAPTAPLAPPVPPAPPASMAPTVPIASAAAAVAAASARAAASAAPARAPIEDDPSFPLVPPPPLPAPPPPPSVAAVPTAAPAPAARRPGGSRLLAGTSPARLLNIAWITAVVVLVLGGAALLALRPFEQLPADLSTPDRRGAVFALLAEGREQMAAGEYAAAAATYGEAERLAPDLPAPHRLRQAAVQKAIEQSRLTVQEAQVGALLQQARQALAGRRFDEAATAATAVLKVDPISTEAQQLLAGATAGRTRRQAQQAAARPVLPAPETPVPAPPTPEPEPAPVEAPDPTKTRLYISFYTELPAGTLIVYLDGQQVMNERFNFYERKGLRREAGSGRVQQSIRVAPGTAELQIYVTPQGGKARTQKVSINFPPGEQRRLDARLDAAGGLSVQMH